MTPRTELSTTTRAHRDLACERIALTLREPDVDARPHFRQFTRVRFLRESAAYLGLCAAGVGYTDADPSDPPGVRGTFTDERGDRWQQLPA